MRLGCIRMVLQYLIGDKIRIKMRLWCPSIRRVLQHLTDEKTIINAFRMQEDRASISYRLEEHFGCV